MTGNRTRGLTISPRTLIALRTVAEMLRRFFLVGLLSIINPGSITQLVVSVTFCVIYLTIQLQVRPFKRGTDTYLALCVSLSLAMLYVGSVVIKLKTLTETVEVQDVLSMKLKALFRGEGEAEAEDTCADGASKMAAFARRKGLRAPAALLNGLPLRIGTATSPRTFSQAAFGAELKTAMARELHSYDELDKRDAHGRTLLMCMCEHGSDSMVKLDPLFSEPSLPSFPTTFFVSMSVCVSA